MMIIIIGNGVERKTVCWVVIRTRATHNSNIEIFGLMIGLFCSDKNG